MKEIEPGMKFVYKSKYSKDYYFGEVNSILHNLTGGGYTTFYGTNGIVYRSDEVEWLVEIRDRKLKELGL